MSETGHAVFLSYAREDAGAARRIADALRHAGAEVWFDQNELRGGDLWDATIRRQIRDCALFLPIISATTQARVEGYFRREWKLAAERTADMAAGLPFIVPVVIDATPEAEAVVPEEFLRYQWTRLPDGAPSAPFVEQVQRLLNPAHRAASSRTPFVGSRSPLAVSGSRPPLAPPASGVPAWTWGALVAVAVGVTTALVVMLKPKTVAPPTAPAVTAAASVPAPVNSDKSIAVLPFTNMSDEKENAFFTDGVHEDILTNLALVREFRVVSRTSVMPYRGTTKPVRQIAQELGVAYLLEGSVRRSGNKVRVTGQLVHAATDEHVWVNSYDRDLTDVFTIQAEVSQQIASALKAVLSPQEQTFIARRPTANPAAYDKFLQAREILNREGTTWAARQKRVALLESAVALDPAFAPAWGELATIFAFGAFAGDENMDGLLARAQAAIDRATALAPEDPEVVSSLGSYYYYAHRDYVRAAAQYDRLARLLPNSPRYYSLLGLTQRRQGRWPEALANLQRAAELDPANLAYQRSLLAILKAGRRWDEAITVQRRLVALQPDSLQEASNLADLILTATGSTHEGEQFLARLTPEQAASPQGIDLRKQWAAAFGDFAEACRLDRLQPYFDGYGQPRWEQDLFAGYLYFANRDLAGAKARLGGTPAELRTRREREPHNYRLLAFIGVMEAVLGNQDEARRAVDRAAELMPVARDAVDGSLFAWYRAVVYDRVGETEKALAEYQRLVRTPNGGLFVHAFRRSFSNLRGDPRFEALLTDPQNNAPLF